MTVEYAPKGLVGVLTPQANTTVEPEFAILCPTGFATIHARLTSSKATLEDRLIDYYQTLDHTIAQFANAPLTVVSSACTGASYLIGPEREDDLFGRLTAARGIPVTNSAYAVVSAFRALGARRIGLVSPYPPSLTAASVRYWSDRGLEVAKVVPVATDASQAHPIYSISARGAGEALTNLTGHRLDAVVMLGTGMPTLEPILASPRVGDAPVFSCMLATVWDAVQRSLRLPPDAKSLLDFIAGTHWRRRFEDRYSSPART
jgi:maleate cis-trans isomerase